MVLDDGSGSGSRRLLQVVESYSEPTKPVKAMARSMLEVLVPETDDAKVGETLQKIAQNGRTGAITPISFPIETNPHIAKILGMDGSPWLMVELDLFGKFPIGYTEAQVATAIQARITPNLALVCATCSKATVVFNNLHTTASTNIATASRRLLQTEPSLSETAGKVTVIMGYTNPDEMFRFSNLFAALLDDAQSAANIPVDERPSISDYLVNAGSMQVVLKDIEVVGNSTTTEVVFDMVNHGTGTVTIKPPYVYNYTSSESYKMINELLDEYTSAGVSIRPFRDYPIIAILFLFGTACIY
jgi:hypothetical protein